MLSLGAMMQGSALPYDLGEAMKPIEELATGAAKAGGAAAAAIGNGVELPAWLLTIALLVLLARFVLYSPALDKIVQGRNDRATQAHELRAREIAHQQELERLRAEYEQRK